jgi:hypothetical protein
MCSLFSIILSHVSPFLANCYESCLPCLYGPEQCLDPELCLLFYLPMMQSHVSPIVMTHSHVSPRPLWYSEPCLPGSQRSRALSPVDSIWSWVITIVAIMTDYRPWLPWSPWPWVMSPLSLGSWATSTHPCLSIPLFGTVSTLDKLLKTHNRIAGIKSPSFFIQDVKRFRREGGKQGASKCVRSFNFFLNNHQYSYRYISILRCAQRSLWKC